MKNKVTFKGRDKNRVIDPKSKEDVDRLLADMPLQADLLIEYVHLIQDEFHCISEQHIRALAHKLKLSTAEVFEVATFYHHFDVTKTGETAPPPLTVRVCNSISCELSGSESLLEDLQTLPVASTTWSASNSLMSSGDRSSVALAIRPS